MNISSPAGSIEVHSAWSSMVEAVLATERQASTLYTYG